MKQEIEKREIGEMILELNNKGMKLTLYRSGGVRAQGLISGNRRQVVKDRKSLLVNLRDVVNDIRKAHCEPTLEEELETELAADEAREGLIVETGESAACIKCGSTAPLIVERKVKVFIPWDGSQPEFNKLWGTLGIAGPPCSGEIGTCPDCGQCYKLGAS